MWLPQTAHVVLKFPADVLLHCGYYPLDAPWLPLEIHITLWLPAATLYGLYCT